MSPRDTPPTAIPETVVEFYSAPHVDQVEEPVEPEIDLEAHETLDDIMSEDGVEVFSGNDEYQDYMEYLDDQEENYMDGIYEGIHGAPPQ